MGDIAVELRTSVAADRLSQALASHGYAATAHGYEVQVNLAAKTRALGALLSELNEWLAGEEDAYGVVRIGGRSYIFEHSISESRLRRGATSER